MPEATITQRDDVNPATRLPERDYRLTPRHYDEISMSLLLPPAALALRDNRIKYVTDNPLDAFALTTTTQLSFIPQALSNEVRRSRKPARPS